MKEQLWIEPVGDIVIARVRGEVTKEIIDECHKRILRLTQEVGHGRVLLDLLEVDPPSVEVATYPWTLELQTGPLKIRRAVLVPNTRIAYLARMAFGENEIRVFYNNLDSAIRWLVENES